MPPPEPAPPNIADLVRGVRARERATIARAITLVESRRGDHQAAARRLVQELLPFTGKAVRVGITGAPGVGKSTTIEALGTRLTGRGHRVAVLAVDPSSTRSGGSILGDKTRMTHLASDAHAFVRPSPSSGTLGGVAAKTRECMLILEAAGYDTVLVETMGAGQSEAVVADMTDFFLVLMLPAAGAGAISRSSGGGPCWRSECSRACGQILCSNKSCRDLRRQWPRDGYRLRWRSRRSPQS